MGANLTISATDEAEDKTCGIETLRDTTQWEAQLQRNKESNKLMVVDFTAAWCTFCRKMAETIRNLAKKYDDVQFVKIDMTSPYNPFMDLSQQFGVRGYPTFILMKNGKPLPEMVEGYTTEEVLDKKIAENK